MGILLFLLQPCWILEKMRITLTVALGGRVWTSLWDSLSPISKCFSCPLWITKSKFPVKQALALASILLLPLPSLPQPSYLPTWFEFSLHWILHLKLQPSPTPVYFPVCFFSLSVSLNSMESCHAFHSLLQLLSCWLYYTVDFDLDQLELIAIFSKILTKHSQKSLVWFHPLLQ